MAGTLKGHMTNAAEPRRRDAGVYVGGRFKKGSSSFCLQYAHIPCREERMAEDSHSVRGVQLPWTETGMGRREEASTMPLAGVF